MNDIQVSTNFKLREFECKCCGTVKLCSDLLGRLQKIRSEANSPLIILSGYRCPAHNSKVGGAAQSQHMEGKAADARFPQLNNYKLVELARKHFPDGGVGVYGNFVHVDTRGYTARWGI